MPARHRTEVWHVTRAAVLVKLFERLGDSPKATHRHFELSAVRRLPEGDLAGRCDGGVPFGKAGHVGDDVEHVASGPVDRLRQGQGRHETLLQWRLENMTGLASEFRVG